MVALMRFTVKRDSGDPPKKRRLATLAGTVHFCYLVPSLIRWVILLACH